VAGRNVVYEGIDRKQLAVLRKRFLRLNRQRLQRMRAAMLEHQRDFADIVSLSLHQNHPILPGYVNMDAPSGISDYTPSKLAVRAAKRLAKSFVLKKRAHLRREILSVFIMGSSGTIAHSGESDFDIWVCHRKTLDKEAIGLLKRKLTLLSRWAKTIGLDAHFFLMDEDYFRTNQSAPMDKEAAGSSQHYLLLDEFYRTAIILAGRAPLWWMVPNEHNDTYADYADNLLRKRYLRATDWIDFGPVPDIPVDEFFGAALWQVYKGIDAPYKAVIKIVLMEVYASMYPDIVPLSADYKEQVYAEDVSANQIDPYLMMYRKVEAYLLNMKAFERLELIRRCFYIKVKIKVGQVVTHSAISWRRELMTDLTRQWGWEQDQLLQLDSRAQWKVNRAQKERRDLVNELTNSYKFLSNFASGLTKLSRITEFDINLLGRKLYAAFERRAGKIEFINPNIAPDLHEEFITFHHHESSSGFNSWLLYKEQVKPGEANYHTPVKRSGNIVELAMWAYVNGLMNRQTQIFLNAESTGVTHNELKQFCRNIISHFPKDNLKPDDLAFEEKAETRYSMVIVNLGQDPMSDLTRRGLQLLSNKTDAIDYGTQHINLAVQFDIISLNSWGEVVINHFEDSSALSDALSAWQASLPDDPQQRPKLLVKCYGVTRPDSVSRRIDELWNAYTKAWYQHNHGGELRYLLKLANDYCLFDIRDATASVRYLNNETDVYRALGKEVTEFSPVQFDPYCMSDSPMPLIYGQNHQQAIELFYHVRNNQAEIWALDEQGVLFHQPNQYFFDHESMLNHYQRFFNALLLRRQASQAERQANIDIRFYELKKNNRGVWQVKSQRHMNDARLSHYLNIQVIATEGPNNQPMYTFFCDNEEISPLEYGDKVLEAVARLILRHRSNNERYPAYITDLDISALANQSQGTASHLSYKMQLEAQLYEELSKG